MSVVYLKAKNRKSGQMEQVGFDGSEVLVGKLKELVSVPALPCLALPLPLSTALECATLKGPAPLPTGCGEEGGGSTRDRTLLRSDKQGVRRRSHCDSAELNPELQEGAN